MSDEMKLHQMTADLQRMMDDFFTVQCRYSAAIKEVKTKLEILDDEFQMKHRRNPIHHIESRLKTIKSIMEKLSRKNHPVSMQSAVENLGDITPTCNLSLCLCIIVESADNHIVDFLTKAVCNADKFRYRANIVIFQLHKS